MHGDLRDGMSRVAGLEGWAGLHYKHPTNTTRAVTPEPVLTSSCKNYQYVVRTSLHTVGTDMCAVDVDQL